MRPCIFILAIFLLSSTITNAAPIRGGKLLSNCPSPSKAIKFYRLFQNNIEHYLYTTSTAVKSRALDDGYEFDGVAARVFKTEQPSTVPFYHVFNRATRDNFYTTDVGARDAALASGPKTAVDEGVAAYVFSRRVCGGVPLYRLYNSATRDHFYTTDESEREDAVTDGGYDDPVIAGFVLRK
ncbi:hypothetical protein FB451DRAFT_1385949 [Mycena latifolia]|nr:hypothetical protein FB451DRAFT_1385949 [Mycena latifolia]